MAVWKPGDITEEPEVILSNWKVLEVNSNDRHFCGYNLSLREGRVSSRIEEFDPSTMMGRTRSGRIYSLRGVPGSHPDADYVWATWCCLNSIDRDSVRDVTKEIIDVQ